MSYDIGTDTTYPLQWSCGPTHGQGDSDHCAHVTVKGYSVRIARVTKSNDRWAFCINPDGFTTGCSVCGEPAVSSRVAFPEINNWCAGEQPSLQSAMDKVETLWKTFVQRYIQYPPIEVGQPDDQTTRIVLPLRWEVSQLIPGEHDLVVELGNTDLMLGSVLNLDDFHGRPGGNANSTHVAKVYFLCKDGCRNRGHQMLWVAGNPLLSHGCIRDIGVFRNEGAAKRAAERALAGSGTVAAIVAALTGTKPTVEHIPSTSGRTLPVTAF